MFEWIKALRALALGIACVGVVGCSQPHDESKPTTTSTSATVLATIPATVEHDLSVDKDTFVTQAGAKSLSLGSEDNDPRQIEVSIARPVVHSRCIEKAELQLHLSGSSGADDVEIGAYASRQFQLDQLHEGQQLGFETILSNRPRGDAHVGTGVGWVTWDVTEIVKRWIDHKVMDGSVVPPPVDGPIVLTLMPITQPTSYRRTFDSIEGETEGRPRLSLRTNPDCSV